MSDKKYMYRKIASVPDVARWDVPRHNQGQIVEVAYADPGGHRDEACEGSLYRRVTDRSDGSVTYYERASYGCGKDA